MGYAASGSDLPKGMEEIMNEREDRKNAPGSLPAELAGAAP
jgi:hypothetical protein